MTAQELIAALDAGPMERLRFVVLREFGVLPCSRAARRMSDADCLRIAAHMAAGIVGADRNEGAECYNSAFDERRFKQLGGRINE